MKEKQRKKDDDEGRGFKEEINNTKQEDGFLEEQEEVNMNRDIRIKTNLQNISLKPRPSDRLTSVELLVYS